MSDLVKLERRRKGYFEKNAQYQKVISSVLGLASVVVGLPLVLFKDIFGLELYNQRLVDILISTSNLLPSLFLLFALISLFYSIRCCLYFYVHSADYIFGILKAFDPDEGRTEYRQVMNSMDKTFGRAINSFILGFISMAVFLVTFKAPAV